MSSGEDSVASNGNNFAEIVAATEILIGNAETLKKSTIKRRDTNSDGTVITFSADQTNEINGLPKPSKLPNRNLDVENRHLLKTFMNHLNVYKQIIEQLKELNKEALTHLGPNDKTDFENVIMSTDVIIAKIQNEIHKPFTYKTTDGKMVLYQATINVLDSYNDYLLKAKSVFSTASVP